MSEINSPIHIFWYRDQLESVEHIHTVSTKTKVNIFFLSVSVGGIIFITCTNAKARRYLENVICLDVWLYTALYYAAMGGGLDSYPPFPSSVEREEEGA